MTLDARLVKKGKNESRERLVQQARVHVNIARRHADVLAEHGWTPRDTDSLYTGLVILDTEMSRQADERGMSRDATRAEAEAVDDAKAFIRRLRYALPRALRTTTATGVSEESFATGGRLGRSTPQISAFLTRIAPAVARLEGDLRPAFGGQSPSKLLVEVKVRLDKADTAQETLLASLPQDTARVYEAKGRVLESIEDLNRAGKSAFDGDATAVALFNKDLLRRGATKRTSVTSETKVSGDSEGEMGCQDQMTHDK